MKNHNFLFEPGCWIGKGTIRFSESPDELIYTTHWQIEPWNGDGITCFQKIEIEGVQEQMENIFTVSDLLPEDFRIRLDNPIFGAVDGTGVIENHVIAWEFRGRQDTGFEGLEIYDRQENGRYVMHAEYASPNQMRTIIDGTIWLADEELLLDS